MHSLMKKMTRLSASTWQRFVTLLAVLPLAGMPATVTAATQNSVNVRRLSLQEALDLTDSRSLDLAQARARLAQAETGPDAARAALLPTVAVQGKYTRNSYEIDIPQIAFSSTALTVGDALNSVAGDLYAQLAKTPSVPAAEALANYQSTKAGILQAAPIVITPVDQLDGSASVQVPLVVPWAWYQMRSANQTWAAAQAGYNVSRAQTMLQVAQYFYQAAGNDEIVAARHHAVDVARKTLNDAGARVEVGAGNQVDRARAQIAFDRAAQAAAEAEAQREQAYRTLSTAIGMTEVYQVQGEGPFDNRPSPQTDLIAMARKARPEFTQNAAQIAASEASSDAYLARWLPTVSAFGLGRIFNYGGFAGVDNAWSAGLQLDWSLYDGGTRDAARRQYAAVQSEATARLALLNLTIADDIANAVRNLEVKRSAVDTADRAVALSQQTLDLIRVQNEAGAISQLDLLSAQDVLVSSELTLAQARFDLALADITLQRQVGTFPRAISGGN